MTTNVFMDEKFIGTIDNPKEFIHSFVEERRKQKISGMVNVGYDSEFDEINIHTATGRVRRPLIIVENG